LGDADTAFTSRWESSDAKRVDAKAFNPNPSKAVTQQVSTAHYSDRKLVEMLCPPAKKKD
jgi:hypothetical protein